MTNVVALFATRLRCLRCHRIFHTAAKYLEHNCHKGST